MICLITIFFFLGSQALAIQDDKCAILENKFDATLKDDLNAKRTERCWIIKVPKRHIITIDIKSMYFEKEVYNGLIIVEPRTGLQYKIDKKSLVPKESIKFQTNVKLIHYTQAPSPSNWFSNFTLSYKIEKGFFPVKFGNGVLDSGVSWLRNQSSNIMGWKDNTPRAVVALFLASAVSFDGNVFEEELMANQVELKAAVAMMKSTTSITELSMIVNALLVTCYNPRLFHGADVIQRLKTLVTRSRDVVHPVAYLALCNANETWPDRAAEDLDSVLNTTSNPQANLDMKAMAVMALSCYLYQRDNSLDSNRSNATELLYDDTIKYFKALQFRDGSFGNVYTTALIAQVRKYNSSSKEI